MRKKIQNLAEGIFSHVEPVIDLSIEKLEIEVLENSTYKGSFTVASTNEVDMKGIVYSSNSRMHCENPKLFGREVRISFEFNSEGLPEGEVQKGKFSIICNGGEYYLSFVAVIMAAYPVTSGRVVKNMFDFTNLAKASLKEAFEVFLSPSFFNIIKHLKQRERMLYEAFIKRPVSLQNMEEFLCELNKKERVVFTVEELEKAEGTMLFSCNEGQVVQESLNIQKHHWGYLHLDIRVDAPAVTLERDSMSNPDFVGNRGTLNYRVNANLLHAGNNFIQIMIKSPYQQEICSLCIHKPSINKRKRSSGLLQKNLAKLRKAFMDYRLGDSSMDEFNKNAGPELGNLIELDPENQWYRLFRAQIFIMNHQQREAERILNAVAGAKTPLYTYSVYLTALLKPEPDAQSSKKKLDLLEQMIANGCCHPVIYMEAYCIIRDEPYLLTKAGKLERQVLHWTMKNNKMTEEITFQVKGLLNSMKKFHPVWYRIGAGCYEAFPDKELLQAVCGYCIKWHCYGKEYFRWYQAGVIEQLRIAGLYEAWIYSVRQVPGSPIPQNVILYFQYNNNLSYQQKAGLYAALLKGRELQKSQYKELLHEIQLFTIEQLRLLKMDENLAVLYEKLLLRDMIDEKIAKALSQLLFINKIYCSDERAVRVIVRHKQLKEEQSVLLHNRCAYISIYSNANCILMEDAKGRRFAANDSWELKRLIRSGRFIETCMQLIPFEIPLLISYFDRKRSWQTFREADVKRLSALLDAEMLHEGYKAELKSQMMEYFCQAYTGESLDNYLLTIEYSGLDSGMKGRMLELMCTRGLYEKAYPLILSYGTGGLSYRRLAAVISYQIEKINFAADVSLLSLSYQSFRNAIYNESMLRYLCKHFTGSVRALSALWEAAKEHGLAAPALEERFLVQSLYTTEFALNTEEIFNSYCASEGDEQVIKAFLSYSSYQFFVKEAMIADDIFYHLEARILDRGERLNEACRLAYFKWLSGWKNLTPRREQAVHELLDEFLLKGKKFAFYRSLPADILRKYHLYDKTFLEYRSDPGNHVTIGYCVPDDRDRPYITEDMIAMFDGVFVKEFVLFYGEVLYYYIYEQNNNRHEIMKSDCYEVQDMTSCENDESCYGLINDMMISLHMQDNQTLLELMEHYLKMEDIMETIFNPL